MTSNSGRENIGRGGSNSARECGGSHGSLRSCRIRFNSWTSYLRRRLWHELRYLKAMTGCRITRMPCGCDGEHDSLRNCWTRFDSSAGHSIAIRASIAARNKLSSECGGFARDPAKVEDQVRFLARTLNDTDARWSGGCLQSSFRVGSIPTGVSDQRACQSELFFCCPVFSKCRRMISAPSSATDLNRF